MKLYYSKGACSLVVRIILNESHTPFEDEAVDLRSKKTASGEDYWLINPKGSVPALGLDNGEVLTENQVLLQYIADKKANHQLLPPINDLKRYRTLEMLNYISTEVHKTFGAFFNPSIPDEIKKEVYTPLLKSRFAFLDKQLAHHDYLMGDQFSLPDPYLFVMLRWADGMKIDLSKEKNLQAFAERMKVRPAVHKSLEQEKLI